MALPILAAILFGTLLVVAWLLWTRPRDPFSESRSVEAEAELIASGEGLFLRLNCISCHGNGGEGIKGPSLSGIVGARVELADGRMVVRDHRYLRRALSEPGAEIVSGYEFVPMPSYDELGETEVVALLLYLRSLDGAEGPLDAQQSPDVPRGSN